MPVQTTHNYYIYDTNYWFETPDGDIGMVNLLYLIQKVTTNKWAWFWKTHVDQMYLSH